MTKIEMDRVNQSHQLFRDLSELLFEIGSAECARDHKEEGIRWLEKASDIMRVHDTRHSADDVELQVAILHRLARTLISIPGNSAKAWSIISDLDSKHSPRLIILILILDYYDYNSDSTGSLSQEYYEIIIRMMQAVQLTDSTLDTILYYTHQLHFKNQRLNSQALHSFILERLLATSQPHWLEKVLLTLIWNSTSSANFTAEFQRLQNLLDTLLAQRAPEVSSSAMSYAAQAVSLE